MAMVFPCDPLQCFFLRQRDAAFVYHMIVLFLEFYENCAVRPGTAIASDPQFFLIVRFLDGSANQQISISIVINVADGRSSILIKLHIGCHRRQHFFFLLNGQHIFQFIAFEYGLTSQNKSSCTLDAIMVQEED